MSLLDTASLVITPNGYKEGKLYSVLPSDGSGDMTVTRATTATRVNASGLVELVPYNLISYSEQFDNAAWYKGGSGTVTANNVTAPDGTLTADRLTSVGDSSFGQSFTLASGQTYTFSVWLKAGTVSSLRIYSTLNSSAPNTLCSLTSEWQRFSLTFTVNQNGNVQIGGGGSFGSGNIYAWGGQLVAGSLSKDYQKTETRLNIPRLDYSNGTCPSILVEPQRTNLFTYSSSFDNANWNKFSATVTANTTTAPDGTNSADQVVFTGFGDIEQEIFYASGNGTHTISCYVKTNSGTQDFRLKLTHAGVANYYSPTYTATTEWQRFTFTQAFGAGGTGFYAGINCTSGTLNLWGIQLEGNSSYATSYIPTTSASVTRNADVISKTGISSLIGQTEGTMFIDIDFKADSVFKNLFNLGTSTSNYIAIVVRSSNKIGAEVLNAGVQVNNEGSTIYTSQRLKIAFAYKANDFAMYVNGVLTFSQNTGSVPAKAEVYLGSYGNGTNQPKDGINVAALWKTRLTNTQLAQLTTI
jgi:hypothetical protein